MPGGKEKQRVSRSGQTQWQASFLAGSGSGSGRSSVRAHSPLTVEVILGFLRKAVRAHAGGALPHGVAVLGVIEAAKQLRGGKQGGVGGQGARRGVHALDALEGSRDAGGLGAEG